MPRHDLPHALRDRRNGLDPCAAREVSRDDVGDGMKKNGESRTAVAPLEGSDWRGCGKKMLVARRADPLYFSGYPAAFYLNRSAVHGTAGRAA